MICGWTLTLNAYKWNKSHLLLRSFSLLYVPHVCCQPRSCSVCSVASDVSMLYKQPLYSRSQSRRKRKDVSWKPERPDQRRLSRRRTTVGRCAGATDEDLNAKTVIHRHLIESRLSSGSFCCLKLDMNWIKWVLYIRSVALASVWSVQFIEIQILKH